MTGERAAELEEPGIVSDTAEAGFERGLAAARAYYELHGNLAAPRGAAILDIQIGQWLTNVRRPGLHPAGSGRTPCAWSGGRPGRPGRDRRRLEPRHARVDRRLATPRPPQHRAAPGAPRTRSGMGRHVVAGQSPGLRAVGRSQQRRQKGPARGAPCTSLHRSVRCREPEPPVGRLL
ncbi:helicase associated domain-containing protein [Streptomyces sp. NPDC002054]|uniref:helicase associated domain-containing protein n=1 Tax=Streptomyces sp. NPDC002054 TaxID=3154663 RepID=UPI003332009C